MTHTDVPQDAWRKEYLGMKIVSKFQKNLLENGPKSLSQSWILQAMYSDWKRMKGYKDPAPIDCQSSLQEWEKSVKKYQTRGTD